MPSHQWIMKFSSPRIFVSHRLDAVDHMARWAAETTPFAQRRRAANGTPDGAPGVPKVRPCSSCVAHEPEWRKPLEAFVVRRLEPADGFLLGVGKVYAGSPDHVFAEHFCGGLAVRMRRDRHATTSSKIFCPLSVTIALSP